MPVPRKSWIIGVASHCVVFAAGWLLVSAIRERTPQNTETSTEQKAIPTKTRPRQTDTASILLRRLAPPLPLSDAPAAPPPVFAPAEDREAAAKEIFWRHRDKNGHYVLGDANPPSQEEMSARFAHWFEADPAKAIAWYVSLLEQGSHHPIAWTRQHLDTALSTTPANVLTNLLPALEHDGASQLRNHLIHHLGLNLARDGRPEVLHEMRSFLHAREHSTFSNAFVRNFPAEHAHELERFIFENKAFDLLAAFARSQIPATERVSWLHAFLEENPELASDRAIKNTIQNLAIGTLEAGLEERISLLNFSSEDTPQKRQQAARSIALTEVSRFFSEAGLENWSRQFKNGELTAETMLEMFRHHAPGLMEREPAAFKSALFGYTWKANPTAAAAFLDTLPNKERHATVIEAAIQGISHDPHLAIAAHELLLAVPVELSIPAQERFGVWTRSTERAYNTHGEYYESWLLSLPHGVERDMALSALALHVGKYDPAKAASLRAAKTLPSGWRPAK